MVRDRVKQHKQWSWCTQHKQAMAGPYWLVLQDGSGGLDELCAWVGCGEVGVVGEVLLCNTIGLHSEAMCDGSQVGQRRLQSATSHHNTCMACVLISNAS